MPCIQHGSHIVYKIKTLYYNDESKVVTHGTRLNLTLGEGTAIVGKQKVDS